MNQASAPDDALSSRRRVPPPADKRHVAALMLWTFGATLWLLGSAFSELDAVEIANTQQKDQILGILVFRYLPALPLLLAGLTVGVLILLRRRVSVTAIWSGVVLLGSTALLCYLTMPKAL
jgi:hypothetical protein